MARHLERESFESHAVIPETVGPVRVTELGGDIEAILRLLPGLGRVRLETSSSAAVCEVIGGYDGIRCAPWVAHLARPDYTLRLSVGRIRKARVLRDHDRKRGRPHRLELVDDLRAVVHRVVLQEPAREIDLEDLIACVNGMARVDPQRALPDPWRLHRLARGTQSELAPLDVRTGWYSLVGPHDGHALTRDLGVSRRLVLRALGEEWARPIVSDALTDVIAAAERDAIPLMVGVGNAGCTQVIHGRMHVEAAGRGVLSFAGPAGRVLLRGDVHHAVWLVTEPRLERPCRGLEVLDGNGDMVVTVALDDHCKDADLVARWEGLVSSIPACARATDL